jgi:osmotically-inducible protein OsmY
MHRMFRYVLAALGGAALALFIERKLAEREAAPGAALPPEDDDATLAEKVMTELFRDPHMPKGAINVNAENGVVLLRGHIEEPEMIVEIVSHTRRIRGVADVENLMHLPGDSVPRS